MLFQRKSAKSLVAAPSDQVFHRYVMAMSMALIKQLMEYLCGQRFHLLWIHAVVVLIGSMKTGRSSVKYCAVVRVGANSWSLSQQLVIRTKS
jgi:hypothetical protein